MLEKAEADDECMESAEWRNGMRKKGKNFERTFLIQTLANVQNLPDFQFQKPLKIT